MWIGIVQENRNSPRETYFSIPKTVILQAIRIESHDVNGLSLWHSLKKSTEHTDDTEKIFVKDYF